MIFSAKLQSMAANEILSMITPFTLERIKQSDPKPEFKAFIVGQEGEASAKLVGVGKIVKTWFKDAIGKIARRIYSGMPIYNGHALTNEQDGREPIGEVVGTRTKEIKGIFSAFIATYIYPEYKSLTLDVASIEADVKMDMLDNEVHAVNVEDVSAVALGDSAIASPGWPGAKFLGVAQAFQAFIDKNTNQLQAGGGDPMTITISEVRSFIKAENLKPSDFFGLGELLKDPMISERVEEEKKEAVKNELLHRKRDEAGFDKTKEKIEADHKKAIEDKDAEIKKLVTETSKTKAADLFTSKAKERKLTDEQIEFIEARRVKGFNPEDPEKLDAEVNTFMDDELVEFKAVAKILGKEIEDPKEVIITGPSDKAPGAGDASIIPD